MPYRPRVDLDRPVHDRLFLRTVPGAVDYLAEDLRALSVPVVGRSPDGVTVDYHGPLRPLVASRYFDVAVIDPVHFEQSTKDGVLAALEPDGPVRFRVGDVEDRWAL